MKILIMPSWYRERDGKNSFSGIFHYEQIKELSKQCTVAVYYLFDRSLKRNMDISYEDEIYTFRSKYQDKRKIGNWVRVLKAFKKINKEYKPDIIYAHVASEVGRYAIVLGKIFSKPVVITEHSAIEYSGMDSGFGKLMGKWIYSNSSCNICVSEELQNKMEKLFPKVNFITLYNGVIQPENFGESRNKYKVKGSINIVLVALLYSKDIKGIQFVIPALRKLIEEGYKIVLHIVGGGNYLDYFKKMANDNDVLPWCIFYGYCEKQKVYQIINEMDFLLSASIVESCGCTIAEAMMLGKPVLVTRSGGPNYFVNENVGILIDKGSSKAIEDGIKDMISRYKSFDYQYIKNYAQENFEMSKVCQSYITIFQNVIKK